MWVVTHKRRTAMSSIFEDRAEWQALNLRTEPTCHMCGELGHFARYDTPCPNYGELVGSYPRPVVELERMFE